MGKAHCGFVQKKERGNFSFDFLLSFQKCQRWRKLATAEKQKKAKSGGSIIAVSMAGHRKIFATLLLLFVRAGKKWEIVYSAERQRRTQKPLSGAIKFQL
jgi:predicted butyrate kinase (DUF1464 family)